MKNNVDFDIINKIDSNKYFFIGFIVGIFPFLLILSLFAFHKGGFEYIPNILRDTLVIASIITSILNAIKLKKMYIKNNYSK